jgi:hypothetical protein
VQPSARAALAIPPFRCSCSRPRTCTLRPILWSSRRQSPDPQAVHEAPVAAPQSCSTPWAAAPTSAGTTALPARSQPIRVCHCFLLQCQVIHSMGQPPAGFGSEAGSEALLRPEASSTHHVSTMLPPSSFGQQQQQLSSKTRTAGLRRARISNKNSSWRENLNFRRSVFYRSAP